jgi:ATP adenylyltransferase
MSIGNDCFYCLKDQRLDDLMIEISKMEVSTLYLFKEQTYEGRCVLAYKGHQNHLTELDDKEYALYMKDLARAAKAIMKAFNPDKLNYGAYSDKLSHLHFHLVPKYQDGPSWGATFEMMPAKKVLLSEAEYIKMINLIQKNL